MTRTDVHSPTNLKTEDYCYAYSFDGHPEDGDRGACVPIVNALLADGWRFDQIHGGDTCDHCGARLRYVAVLKHVPTRTLIKVGETCLENRFELATADFHRLRKSASLNRERNRRTDRLAAWLEIEDNRRAFDFCSSSLDTGDHGYNGMRYDFVQIVNKNGGTSEKFVAAILRDMERTTAWAAKRAAERAETVATGSPVVTGKGITIEGEVVSVGIKENAYGVREVMTVKDDRGFKVWGTNPAFLSGVEKGSRVKFVANVEVSDNDQFFGWFSRPRAAKS